MADIQLGRRTSAEATEPHVLLVPLGSTEQHGPHLPLDTDTAIAAAVAERAAVRIDQTVLVAPPLPFGASGEHQGFAGTMSIGVDGLKFILIELVRSLDPQPMLTLFVNGHGGNLAAVHAATTQLRGEGHRVAAWFPSVAGGDAHAGHVETSIMLALDPTAVRLDLAEPGRGEPLSELLPELVADGVKSVSPNGVLGDPSGASPEAGQQILTDLVDNLVDSIRRDTMTR